MPAWLSALFDSFGPEAVGGSEAVMSGGAAPVSIGQQASNAVGNMISPQLQPYQNFYNTAMNPNASMADTARSGFQLAFNPNEDEKNLGFKQMPNAQHVAAHVRRCLVRHQGMQLGGALGKYQRINLRTIV